MQQSRTITRKSASNLALAFVLLPREKRDAMSALYAFSREVDDVADDESLPVEERRERLAAWRADIHRACAAENPRFPVNRELQPFIERHRLRFELFDELLKGVEMDLAVKRYAGYAELEQYCYRVASVVGLLSIEIFGYQNPACRAYAVSLGQALQLTNILRDVRSDAGRGRIYLPLAELERFQVTPEEILRLEYSERFRELAAGMARRARHFYQLARTTLPEEDRRSMVAAELMGSVYWRLLRKLERRQFDVFGPKPTRLNKGQKILLVLRTGLRLFFRRRDAQRMARPDPARRLIVNADDFGRSSSINQAVIEAHLNGILTTASLMVNEPAVAEAVALAKRHPSLGVGLHLTLSHGRSALSPEEVPGLVNSRGEFSHRAEATGWRYFAHRELREQLRREIRAQFDKFQTRGLAALDHVNGHLHFHLHPTVFGLLMDAAPDFGIRRMRLTRDPFWLNARLASGQWAYRATHAFIYHCLAARARGALQRRKIQHTHRVFGLLQNNRVDESYVTGLLSRLPAGDSELYSHPSLDEFKHEFAALVSTRVKTAVQQTGIQLIRYQDL